MVEESGDRESPKVEEERLRLMQFAQEHIAQLEQERAASKAKKEPGKAP